MHWKRWPALLAEAGSEWMNDNAMRLSAALAYYAILSLAPLALIVIAISGLAYGEQAANAQVARQIREFAGEQAGSAILSIIESARHKGPSTGAALAGLAVLLLGASGVFGELKEAMNSIWGVSAKPGQALWALLCQRLLAFLLVLASGLLMLLALAASAILAALKSHPLFFLPGMLLQAGEFAVSFSLTCLIFTAIFKLLPDVEIRWRDVWPSGVVTALLFGIGKILFGLYLGTSGISSTYGAAGSAIVVLLWAYYSACILFFGAELCKVSLRQRGRGIVPRANAVRTPPQNGGSPP